MRHHSTFGQKYKYNLDKFNKTLFVQRDYMSLKNNILRALSLYRKSAFKNFFKEYYVLVTCTPIVKTMFY